MSKPVRLKNHLAAELERIAARENRSLANLVNHLLEQAIGLSEREENSPGVATDPGGAVSPSTSPRSESSEPWPGEKTAPELPAVIADAQPRDVVTKNCGRAQWGREVRLQAAGREEEKSKVNERWDVRLSPTGSGPRMSMKINLPVALTSR